MTAATSAPWTPVRVIALTSWNGDLARPYRELAREHPNLITLHELAPTSATCADRELLPGLIHAPAGALLIDGHGWHTRHFAIGNHDYTEISAICAAERTSPKAAAIILSVCYALAPRVNSQGGMTATERTRLLGAAQFAIGGRGVVGRDHGPVYARTLVEALANHRTSPRVSAAVIVDEAEKAHQALRQRFPKWRANVEVYAPQTSRRTP